LFNQKKRNDKHFKIIQSVGILAAFLMLVSILGIQTYNTTYSSISSSIYDNIQKNFDNLLPFEVPQLDKEGKKGSQSNDDSKYQSAQKNFDNLLPFEVPQLDNEGKKGSQSNDDSKYQSAQKNFDNLLPFEVPQLDNEGKKGSQSNDDSKYQSAQKKFDNPIPYKVSPQGEKIPLELPPLDEDFPFEVPQIDDEEKTDSQSGEMAATADTSCRASTFYDNFVGQYLLREGQTSPNGLWKNAYSGYGSTGVKHNYDGRNAFWLYPQAATSAAVTHAAEVQSTSNFCNFLMKVDMNTVQPLRKNSPANTWEVGWLFFRYVDDHHHYYFLAKPNGIELGKKDCDICKDPVDGDQVYLVTKTTPKLQMNTWNTVKIDMIGNHIWVYWNGKLVIDYIDKTMSPKLASGKIAMYSEDAYVLYDNMKVYRR
jgi:hypothetical protein